MVAFKIYAYAQIFFVFSVIIVIFTFTNTAHPEDNTEILKVGIPAPEWVVSEWINSPPLMLKKLQGNVVVVDFFQLWCPGCNSFSIPLMLRWEEKYKNVPNIQLVGIHTVFEGHRYQTPEHLKNYIRKKGITHPIGVDRYVSSSRLPETMIRYQTRGTPEMAIIDKHGIVRFKEFGSFNIVGAERLIERLLED